MCVCLSVVAAILVVVVACKHDNFRNNHRIKLSFGILYQSRKKKDKFVNQPHLIKIVKMRAFFVFLKFFYFEKSKIAILVSDGAHKSLLIIRLIIFD